ncbi:MULTISPECIES: OmpA family protein [unclassified Lentilitoribacter]|jgi:outer membrane protein OmpA-like peptidoglycan-associated protein|uniref:OmpA family protein n=1 Tax=unclassified Lentilitoribacter TaxID=2647570 RepID=UPI0013A6C055|nr:OmpA family protein [Lentilitoribacter sp. Alg239-R112]
MKTQIIATLLAGVFLASCTTTDPYTGQQKISNTGKGAALGAAAGAGLGLLAGGDDRRNALVGAGIGLLAGGAIGNYMDQQEAELRAQLQGTGVTVTRNGNQIILNMPSNITFDVGQSVIKPTFVNTLNGVSIVVSKFNKTLVDVYGHTDSTGSDQSNQILSNQRAQSVANYLSQTGVDPRRFRTLGFGETRPIADNSTEFGRAANRRVEIQLSPLS